jgi:5'-3' exonuclease
MGIPSFFLNILKNKFYKNIHSGVTNGKIKCDYFFMDYNGIVYKAYERIRLSLEGKNLNKDQIEELVIEEVIRYTKYLICTVVKPSKLTYIALDGPAPRAKMVQQRSRRYTKIYEKNLIQNEKKRLKINKDDVYEWDGSANISPGTEFMEKLSNRLIGVIKNKGFSDHQNKMQVLLSNSNVPGEGEHKFLPTIRAMRVNKTSQNDRVYFYGSDADLIVLALSTHKNNIHIFREVDNTVKNIFESLYDSYEFIDVNIDNLGNAFNHELTRTFEGHNYDKIRILNDYIFLTFLVGNDFVISMPFLKIRKNGLEMLIAIYHDIKENHNGYLVDYHPDKEGPPTINIAFFKELMNVISTKEDFFMKEHYQNVVKVMSKKKDFKYNRRIESEKTMTPFDIFFSRYTHLEVYSPDHPLYEKYHTEFLKIEYNKDYEIWKEQYYEYFLNINKKDEEEYLKMRIKVVENYLESLMFALKYYFQGCPDWQWYYKFRMSPLMSDICYVLNNSLIDMNNIEFKKGDPYTPFQQLMLILPPQMNNLVPSVLRPIMLDDKLLCTQFYPIDFNIDVIIGMKVMYSEAILPEIDEDILINVVKKYEEKLKPEERERNIIKEKPVKG